MTDPPEPATEPLIGGRYHIERPIGSGNMGDVYRGRHHLTERPVALKFIKPHVAQASGGIERFLREVRATQAVGHAGVVEVLDAGAHGKTLYVAMELLEGESLRERQERGGLPIDEALTLLRALLEPLAAAHAVGIVHRDLKPDNVYLHQRPDGERVVKLLDFGIAAVPEAPGATQTGFTMGTPYYMSPEQAIDPRACTPASDVWSVGAMLYEILAGEVPFEGATAHAVCAAAIHQPHPDLAARAPDTPPALLALVDRCLAKAPEDRPADARALAIALDAARADTRVAPGPLLEPEGAAPPRRRAWALWLAVAATAAAATVWLTRASTPAEPAAGAPDATWVRATPLDRGPAPAALAADASAPDLGRPDAAPAVDAGAVDAGAVDAAPAPPVTAKAPARPTPPASRSTERVGRRSRAARPAVVAGAARAGDEPPDQAPEAMDPKAGPAAALAPSLEAAADPPAELDVPAVIDPPVEGSDAVEATPSAADPVPDPTPDPRADPGRAAPPVARTPVAAPASAAQPAVAAPPTAPPTQPPPTVRPPFSF